MVSRQRHDTVRFFFGGELMLGLCKQIGLVGLLGSVALAGCGGKTDSQSGSVPVQTLAQRAGAPLFEGMGDYHMPITTADPDAQRYFDQGMVLAFGFNHAESIRSFRAAQSLDRLCAMCFWGEALATGPNINVTSNGKAVMTATERADTEEHAEEETEAGESESS